MTTCPNIPTTNDPLLHPAWLSLLVGKTGCSRLPSAGLVAAAGAKADMANHSFHPWAVANLGRAVPSEEAFREEHSGVPQRLFLGFAPLTTKASFLHPNHSFLLLAHSCLVWSSVDREDHSLRFGKRNGRVYRLSTVWANQP